MTRRLLLTLLLLCACNDGRSQCHGDAEVEVAT